MIKDYSKLQPAARGAAVLRDAIVPACDFLRAYKITSTGDTLRMILATGFQESEFTVRDQYDKLNAVGPATSFWQMERGRAGIMEVLTHPATDDAARALCAAQGVAPDTDTVWRAFTTNDILGAGFARLLLWRDPARMPTGSEQDAGWSYYVRNWKPGRPRPEKWPTSWGSAVSALRVG